VCARGEIQMLIRMLALAAVTLTAGVTASAQVVEEGATLLYSNKRKALELKKYPNITLDHLGEKQGEVYGPKGLYQLLDRLGLDYLPHQKATRKEISDY